MMFVLLLISYFFVGFLIYIIAHMLQFLSGCAMAIMRSSRTQDDIPHMLWFIFFWPALVIYGMIAGMIESRKN